MRVQNPLTHSDISELDQIIELDLLVFRYLATSGMVSIASLQYLLKLVDGRGEIALLPFHPEADNVTLATAGKTVPVVPPLVDPKTRHAVVMERAQPHRVGGHRPQLHILANKVDKGHILEPFTPPDPRMVSLCFPVLVYLNGGNRHRMRLGQNFQLLPPTP